MIAIDLSTFGTLEYSKRVVIDTNRKEITSFNYEDYNNKESMFANKGEIGYNVYFFSELDNRSINIMSLDESLRFITKDTSIPFTVYNRANGVNIEDDKYKVKIVGKDKDMEISVDDFKEVVVFPDYGAYIYDKEHYPDGPIEKYELTDRYLYSVDNLPECEAEYIRFFDGRDGCDYMDINQGIYKDIYKYITQFPSIVSFKNGLNFCIKTHDDGFITNIIPLYDTSIKLLVLKAIKGYRSAIYPLIYYPFNPELCANLYEYWIKTTLVNKIEGIEVYKESIYRIDNPLELIRFINENNITISL